MGKLILFGAGVKGLEAKEKYGKQVAFFCDNNKEKVGKKIDGIEVISFDRMKELYYDNYIIMITPINNTFMIAQLEKAGIEDYLLYVVNKMGTSNHIMECEDSWWEPRIKEYLKKCKGLDLLSDITSFKELAKEVLEDTTIHGYPFMSGRLWESYHYGNLQALANYAGIEEDILDYSPIVSHVDCVPLLSAEFYTEATVMSGDYYKNKIHNRYPYVPVFSVGPYIYYADGIYSEEQFKERKKQIGNMLLVFLPHSEEFVKRVFNKNQFIDEIIDKYGHDFDSIWMCSFWIDINDSVCEYAEKRGIHVVTAGFRFDSKFDRRLRTIIELSDAVVCADIGTFIGYSLMLNKPIARLDISNLVNLSVLEVIDKDIKEIQLVDEYHSFEQRFAQVFTDEFKLSKELYEWIEPYIGFTKIRSKEYIRKIFDISKAIFERCEKYNEEYSVAVRRTYYEYYENNMIEEMYILKTAVGGYLD